MADPRDGYDKLDPDKWRVYLSALIKSWRRSLVDDAIYWSAVLYQYDRAKQVWLRMLIHLSEDIGPAEPNLPANIQALHENYKLLKAGGHKDAAIVYTHAIILMAQAKKSRIADNATIVYHRGTLEDRPVPDYAFDHHGSIGRELGRGVEYFFEEAAQGPKHDRYTFTAKKIAIENENAIPDGNGPQGPSS